MQESNKPAPHIYLGLPTYNGESPADQLFSVLAQTRSKDFKISVSPFKFSMLTYAFNFLWADALNKREEIGITHFLLLHSDVVPSQGQEWVKILLDEMETVGADVMSAIIPIKTPEGLTSTGTQIGEPYHPWAVKRYTMQEVFRMPETFSHDRLAINTGMMLVDIRKPWVEEIYFDIRNDMIKNKKTGKFEALAFPEDWLFSQMARDLGAKVYATRKVKLGHRGGHEFTNEMPWGKLTDEAFLKIEPNIE